MKNNFSKLWLAVCTAATIFSLAQGQDYVEPLFPCLGTTGVLNIPHPYDCTRFYICVNGMDFPNQCSEGLIFDVLTNQCNREEISVCIVDVPTIPTAGPGETTPAPGLPSEEPVETPAPIPTAPVETTTVAIPTAPTEGPGGAETTEAPAAPTPGTTEAPAAPTPAPTTTPPPVVVTTTPAPPAPTPEPAPVTTTPVAPTPAPTPAPAPVTTTTVAPPVGETPVCNAWDDFYAPHPDCTRFFRCVFGTLHVLECPPNQFWNQARLWCDHQWNVDCPASG